MAAATVTELLNPAYSAFICTEESAAAADDRQRRT